MKDADEKFERLLIGLADLTPLAKRRLLEKMQESQPIAVGLLNRVYASEQISVAEKEQLLTALESHSDVVIRSLREWNARVSEASPRQADEDRNEPSAKDRGDRRPGLDDYDTRSNRENRPDKYQFGKFNR